MGLSLFGPPGLNGPPNDVHKLMTSPRRYRRRLAQAKASPPSQATHPFPAPNSIANLAQIPSKIRSFAVQSIELSERSRSNVLERILTAKIRTRNLELKSVARGRRRRKTASEGEAWIRSRRFWGCTRGYRGCCCGFWRRRSGRRWSTSTSPSPSPSSAPSSSCTPISSNRFFFVVAMVIAAVSSVWCLCAARIVNYDANWCFYFFWEMFIAAFVVVIYLVQFIVLCVCVCVILFYFCFCLFCFLLNWLL